MFISIIFLGENEKEEVEREEPMEESPRMPRSASLRNKSMVSVDCRSKHHFAAIQIFGGEKLVLNCD